MDREIVRHRSWGFHRPYRILACQNHSFTRRHPDPVFHLLTCLELYEGVLGLPATLIPLNEQRQVVCQAQGSPRVVLGLSRYSVLFTVTERFGSVQACVVDRSRGVWIGDRSATARFDPRVPDASTQLDSTMVRISKTIAKYRLPESLLFP